jgi:hypothetical protein
METKGIVTSEQIEKYKRDNDVSDSIYKELSLKDMMISCFCYSSIEKNTYDYIKYIQPRINKLPKDVGVEVYNEMYDFLTKNCTVETNTYTDNEGLNYNTLIIK